jgi:hypothetical protein
MMRIEEGRSSNVIELNDPHVYFTEGAQLKSYPLEWAPPGVKFKPVEFSDYQVRVEEFISHADPSYEFPEVSKGQGQPAIKILVQGGFMRIRQEYWLWAGDPAWAMVQAGPALFSVARGESFATGAAPKNAGVGGMPGVRMDIKVNDRGEWAYRAVNSEGKIKSGTARTGDVIEPGWKGGVTITLQEARPFSSSVVRYVPAQVQYGNQAPPSAIRISAGVKGEASMWLGLGDRATLSLKDREVGVAYLPKRYILPYSLRLDRFSIFHYEGTRNPSSFESAVTVSDPENPEKPLQEYATTVSMNEPLQHRDLTFYQASYEPGEPRPTVSVFSVNRDPGRLTKYIGSILLVAGVIWLFVEKLRKAKALKNRQSSEGLVAGKLGETA